MDGREISNLCGGSNSGEDKLLVQAEQKNFVGNDPPGAAKAEPAALNSR